MGVFFVICSARANALRSQLTPLNYHIIWRHHKRYTLLLYANAVVRVTAYPAVAAAANHALHHFPLNPPRELLNVIH